MGPFLLTLSLPLVLYKSASCAAFSSHVPLLLITSAVTDGPSVSSAARNVAGEGKLDKGCVAGKGRWALFFSSDVPPFRDSAT